MNFLYVGSFIERKNVETLITAFATLLESYPESKLTVVNRSTQNVDKFLEWVNYYPKVKDNLIYKKDISFEELKQEYRKADVFMFITLIEGFGLPLVEAMSMGVPIITSGKSIHKEITGNTQIYVNPESVLSVAFAMKELIKNPKKLKEIYTIAESFNHKGTPEIVDQLKGEIYQLTQKHYKSLTVWKFVNNLFYRDIENIFIFVTDPEVKPTNNISERELRELVIIRNISKGSRSKKGANTTATLLSIIQTLRLNQKNVLLGLQEILNNKNTIPQLQKILTNTSRN